MSPCTHLSWDSDFFELPIATVSAESLTLEQVAEIDDWCAEQRIACLYFACDVADQRSIQAACAGGFDLVDVRLTFEAATSTLAAREADSGAVVRPALAKDVPQLRVIAAQAHHDTRFYADPNFPRARCDELYATWISNSVHGFADRVLVADGADSVCGYVTCHGGRGAKSGRIGLIAVAPHCRGRGVGAALLRSAAEWFAANAVATMTALTQVRSISAQRLYQRCDFLTRRAGLYYHKWYQAPAAP